MSKEKYNQIIDEVWSNYRTAFVEGHVHQELDKCLPIEEFIEEIKSDNEFSEKWGLKIEERELTPKERIELAGGKIQDKYQALVEMSLRVCDERDIPTKVITLTYNNETVITYE